MTRMVYSSTCQSVPSLSLAQKTLKKNWDKTVLKTWSQNIEEKIAKFGHKLTLKKDFFT